MSVEMARTQAMTAAGGLLVDLEDAIAALTALDGDRLEQIERRVNETLGTTDFRTLVSGVAAGGGELSGLWSRKQVLGILLENTGRNLRVLERLHSRGAYGGDVWVR
ncbi:hypothetical protein [Granulicella sibirica]|uniref:Uncharacterized protein n=1 Tax=Granulicella sibirica TaxID=2479048 RepID=A0A4Q0T1G4_9BACT|nr:hypothetical protein [Granulicella sibirica]RXH55808.1 hypothetical protein GRAN_2665 [Granulicella sibirica]